jgi:hypothetical protein
MKYRTYNPRVGGPAASTDAGKKIIAAAVKVAMQDIAARSRGGSVVEHPKGTYSLYLNEGVPKVDVSFSKENVHVRPESVNALTERISREGSAADVAAQVVAQVLAFAGKPWRWTSALKQNPPPTYDTCPPDMDYNWWVQHYAPQHVREAARAQALAEVQRLYAPPPLTAKELARDKRNEAAYGRAMRREARRNPGVEQVILLVLPHVTKALGSKVTAFNALPIPERKARLRAFLQSGRRWSLGAAGGLVGPQIAKSDTALNAIIRNVEHYGSQAVARGGEEVATRLQKNPRRGKKNPGSYGLGTLHWRKIQEEAARQDVPPESLLPRGHGRATFRPSDLAYASMRMMSGGATRKDLLVLSKWSGQDLTKPSIDQEYWGEELFNRFRQEYPEEARKLNLD